MNPAVSGDGAFQKSSTSFYGTDEDGYLPYLVTDNFFGTDGLMLSPALGEKSPAMDTRMGSSGMTTPRRSRRGQGLSSTAGSADVSRSASPEPGQSITPRIHIESASNEAVLEAVGKLQAHLMLIENRLGYLEQCIFPTYYQQPQIQVGSSGTTSAALQSSPRSSRSLVRPRDLDSILVPHFNRNHTLTSVEINQLTRQIESHFPTIDRRRLVSEVRKWYRKKRDENGQRIFAACEEYIKPQLESGVNVDELKAASVDESTVLYQDLKRMSDLPFEDPLVSRQFLTSKIDAYFTRRVEGRR